MQISSPPELVSSRLELVRRLVESSRRYTRTLLDGLDEDQWFWSPPQYSSHIAWQVGHVAVAQYGLMLFRQRGRRDSDGELMSGSFRKLFAKGSQPTADRQAYPTPAEILDVLGRIHQQSLTELATWTDEHLDEPADPPHAAFETRYGSLLFCPQHEMLHAGQIGLLRRLMGLAPVR